MLRIFPLYYFYLLLILIVLLVLTMVLPSAGGNNGLPQLLRQIPWAFIYLYNFFCATTWHVFTPLLSPLWSLAIEEQFYLVWPLLIFLVPRPSLRTFLLAMIGLGPVWRLGFTWLAASNQLPFLVSRTDMVVGALPFAHIDAFALGGFCALYPPKAQSNWLIGVLAGSLVLLGYEVEYVATGQFTPLSLGYTSLIRYQYVWSYSLVNVVFAALIAQIKAEKFFPRLLNMGWLNYLGQISYGLYVLHFPMIWLAGSAHPFFALGLTIGLSTLSYELLEKRFIKMKDTLFANRPARR